MQVRILLGALAIGFVVLCAHGQTPPNGSTASNENKSTEVKKKVPEALETLNIATRKLYAGARALELTTIPAVIVMSGDDLILRKKDKRIVETVIPPEYHSLKCVAHSMLALYTHLSYEPGKPLSEERIKTLNEYRANLVAAGPAVELCGFDAETLSRQKRIISRGLSFIDTVLKDGQVSASDLTKYCRESRQDTLLNAAAAARSQLLAMHRQVMEWKKAMSAEEWNTLTVVILGMQTPRVDNAAVQYFARLFGETRGEGRRVVYAEGLGDEEKAINLLGTLRLDGKLSIAVFNDPFRMYRDLLADVARPIIDEILAGP